MAGIRLDEKLSGHIQSILNNQADEAVFKCPTEKAARALRLQFYSVMRSQRKFSREMFKDNVTNPGFGASDLDDFSFSISGTNLVVRRIPPIPTPILMRGGEQIENPK